MASAPELRQNDQIITMFVSNVFLGLTEKALDLEEAREIITVFVENCSAGLGDASWRTALILRLHIIWTNLLAGTIALDTAEAEILAVAMASTLPFVVSKGD